MCNQNFATETSTAQFRLWTLIFLILAHSSPFFYRYFDIFDTLSLKKIVEIFSFRLILFCKNRRDLYFFLKSSETWDKRRQRCWFLVGQLISKVKYINLEKKNMAAILSGLKFSFEIEFWTDKIMDDVISNARIAWCSSVRIVHFTSAPILRVLLWQMADGGRNEARHFDGELPTYLKKKMVRGHSVLDELVDVVLCSVLAGRHLEDVGRAQQSFARVSIGDGLKQR